MAARVADIDETLLAALERWELLGSAKDYLGDDDQYDAELPKSSGGVGRAIREWVVVILGR